MQEGNGVLHKGYFQISKCENRLYSTTEGVTVFVLLSFFVLLYLLVAPKIVPSGRIRVERVEYRFL